MKFRRATHDKDTGEYLQKFANIKAGSFEQKVWDVHGDICHHLSTNKLMSYEDVLDEVRKDITNYDYHPNDLKIWRDGGKIPTPEEVALSLVRLIEAGYVEVHDEKKFISEQRAIYYKLDGKLFFTQQNLNAYIKENPGERWGEKWKQGDKECYDTFCTN